MVINSVSCPESQPGRLLTLKEAAERLTISLPTIRSWVAKRKIEVVRIGRCVRIREETIHNIIKQNTFPAKMPGRNN
jgi:excisionase family DNA binding protein